MGLFSPKRKLPPRPFGAMLVLAAGSGERIDGRGKAMIPLEGQPAVLYSLLACQKCAAVDEVIVVARSEDIIPVGELCKRYALSKVKTIVKGGVNRVASTLIGLSEISHEAEVVGVHDAARPCVSAELMTRVMEAGARLGAAAPGVPPNDTVKRLDSQGGVRETLDRASLTMVQTPQCFQPQLIRAALERANREGWRVTDDCSAVERMGMRVHILDGERTNIKITYRSDLVQAAAILREGNDAYWNRI